MSILYEDFAAVLYSALWPLTLDGRFQEASRGQNFSIFFHFDDWPPAIILRIVNGTFKIEKCDLNEVVTDGSVEGKFADLITALEGPRSALRLLISRKVKLKNKRILLKFARILLAKGVSGNEGVTK